MKAAVLKAADKLELSSIPQPVASEEMLVVQVKSCGISSSDIRQFQGEPPQGRPNVILGHAFTGVVTEVQNELYAAWAGKRVAVLPTRACGVCDTCRRGNYQLCKNTKKIGYGTGWDQLEYAPGGLAEYCPVWNDHVYELPDSVSFEEATVLEPLAEAIHAITQANMKPGDNVLVYGCGVVGMCIAQAVKAFGANQVICVDTNEALLDLAQELNATGVANGTEQSIASVLTSRGIPKVDIVFDTVGTAESQHTALAVLEAGGILVNLVCDKTSFSYQLMELAGEKRVVTSVGSRSEDFLLGIKLVESGAVKAQKMITHRFSLEDVQQGVATAMNQECTKVLQVVVNP